MNNCYFIPPECLDQKDGADIAAKSSIASIIYSLLFEGEVIFSDAVLVNVAHLRTAFKNRTIRDLILNQKLSFARRKENSAFISLTSLANEIIEKNAINPTFTSKEQFLDYSSLLLIEKKGKILPYTLDESQAFYTEGLMKSLLENDYGKFMPEKIQKLVITMAQEKLSEKGYLESVYFQREHAVGADLKKRSSDDLAFKKYGDFIFSVSMACYYTYIPSKYNATPIYGKEHTLAFDIWRNTISSRQEQIGGPAVLKSLVGPLTFVEGLLRLTFDDIMELIESDEYKAYNNAIENLDNSTLKVKEVERTYEVYKRRIDWLILKHLGMLNKEDYQYKVNFQKRERYTRAGDVVMEFLVMKVLDACTFSATAVFKMLYKTHNALKTKDEEIDTRIKSADTVEDVKEKLAATPTGLYQQIQSKTHINSEFNDVMLNYTTTL